MTLRHSSLGGFFYSLYIFFDIQLYLIMQLNKTTFYSIATFVFVSPYCNVCKAEYSKESKPSAERQVLQNSTCIYIISFSFLTIELTVAFTRFV